MKPDYTICIKCPHDLSTKLFDDNEDFHVCILAGQLNYSVPDECPYFLEQTLSQNSRSAASLSPKFTHSSYTIP